MAKRSSNIQLTHENWDEELEQEERGTFTVVDPAELQSRVIRKAKRRVQEADVSDGEKQKPTSPFAAFAGFTSNGPKPVFSFHPKQEPDTAVASSTSVASENKSELPNNNSVNESKAKSSKKLCCETESKKKDDADDIQYFKDLQTLNENVISWIQMHFAKNPCSDFTPVFNDYSKHLKRLEDKYALRKTAATNSEQIPKAKLDSSVSSTGFSFRQNMGRPSHLNSEKLENSEMLYGAGFASNTTNTSTFSFGIKPALTATSPGSNSGPTASHSAKEAEEEEEPNAMDPPKFSFGDAQRNTHSTEKSEFGLNKNSTFSFVGASSGFSFANHTQSTTNDDDEEVPPKNDFKIVSEDDALYSKRCKLFFKKDDQFVEKGIGMLYLKTLDGKTQLLIRADTNLGNILLNIRLSSTLPMSRSGKNNVLVVCVPNPPLDAKSDSSEAVPMLIRVKTSDDADELLSKLNQFKS